MKIIYLTIVGIFDGIEIMSTEFSILYNYHE